MVDRIMSTPPYGALPQFDNDFWTGASMSLCTIADVKAITPQEGNDVQIQLWIDAASLFIERWCDRLFLVKKRYDYHTGDGTSTYALRHPWLQQDPDDQQPRTPWEVLQIWQLDWSKRSGSDESLEPIQVERRDLVWFQDLSEPGWNTQVVQLMNGAVFTRGNRLNWLFGYIGGLWAKTDNVDPAMRHVCALMVADRINEARRRGTSVDSLTVEATGESMVFTASMLTAAQRSMLATFRRVGP